jgi:hypothetical protein
MKKSIIYILFLFVTLAGCTKSILERTDFNGIPEDQVWTNEGTATLYLNNLYNVIMPLWPSNLGATTLPISLHNSSDDQNTGDSKILQGTLTVEGVTDFYTTSPPSNIYGYIRKCNILISQIDNGTLAKDVKDKLKAQAYFLRAYLYFHLVKLYGGVPYIKHPQDWQTEEVLVPRDKTSDCIKYICEDLDQCSTLPSIWPTGDFGRITRGAAKAFKGRVLLFWASEQFNPGNKQPARWDSAYKANKEAYDLLVTDGYALNAAYASIFDKSAANKEPLIVRVYNGATDVTNAANNYENVTRPYSETSGSGGSQNQPTWNLVQSYPMKDGKTITTSSSTYPYDAVYYWKNRDPRFDASIAYNGNVWSLSGKSGRKQWIYQGIVDDKTRPSTTGFYCKKNLNNSMLAANTAQGSTNWVEMRFAEVLLNLAECANRTTKQPEAYDMLKQIRKRAGIVAGSDNLYGLDATMNTTVMDSIIFNERRIEFAFEGKRYDDLRRTRRFHLLNGTSRLQLEIVPKGTTAAALETADVNGVLFRDKLNMDGADYTTYFTATVKPMAGSVPIAFPESYYFYAIPTTNITKNPNMKQTNTWGGSFDPTE